MTFCKQAESYCIYFLQVKFLLGFALRFFLTQTFSQPVGALVPTGFLLPEFIFWRPLLCVILND